MRLDRMILGAMAAGLVLALALNVPRNVTADDDDDRDRECSNATLRGPYGINVSGIRPAGPGVTEMFAGIAVRTYDGQGAFSHLDKSKGQITQTSPYRMSTGTYDVSANCTGTAIFFPPGLPAIETSFVIVERGKQVKEITTGPGPAIVTAIGHKQ